MSQKAGLEIPLGLTIKVLNKILQKAPNSVGLELFVTKTGNESVFVENSLIF